MESETRAKALLNYLYTILDELLESNEYQIKANFLDKDIESYSIDRIPVDPIYMKWITGETFYRDVYNFRTRKRYSSDQSDELKNIGFFEKFEKIIRNNNDSHNLPKIKGIESIKCLSCGSQDFAEDNTCEMSIQIEIVYKEDKNDSNF